MESVKHRSVTANGIRQHYIDAGQGPAVVLLHGFPFTNYTWRNQIPELSKKYRVVAPDMRGYGAGAPRGRAPRRDRACRTSLHEN
jgi:pimeloyl-ACP methyl ester carboxylesterase